MQSGFLHHSKGQELQRQKSTLQFYIFIVCVCVCVCLSDFLYSNSLCVYIYPFMQEIAHKPVCLSESHLHVFVCAHGLCVFLAHILHFAFVCVLVCPYYLSPAAASRQLIPPELMYAY